MPLRTGTDARSLAALRELCDDVLPTPIRAFGGRTLTDLVDPGAVSPPALDALEREAGAALFTSPHWLRDEALRLLAICSQRMATEPGRLTEVAALQDGWMLRLGTGVCEAMKVA